LSAIALVSLPSAIIIAIHDIVVLVEAEAAKKKKKNVVKSRKCKSEPRLFVQLSDREQKSESNA
jgi:hypothetical protein